MHQLLLYPSQEHFHQPTPFFDHHKYTIAAMKIKQTQQIITLKNSIPSTLKSMQTPVNTVKENRT